MVSTLDAITGLYAYANTALDKHDAVDATKFPAAQVLAPQVEGSELLSENFARVQYSIPVLFLFSDVHAVDQDDNAAQWLARALVALGAVDTVDSRTLGIFPNGFAATSAEWVTRGQDAGYLVTFSVTCQHAQTVLMS